MESQRSRAVVGRAGGSGCMREEVEEARPRPGVEERGEMDGVCLYVCMYKYFPDVCVRNGRGVGQALEEETGAVVRLLEKSCWDRKLSFPSLAHFLTPSHCSRTRRGTQVKVESHGSGKKPHEPSR